MSPASLFRLSIGHHSHAFSYAHHPLYNIHLSPTFTMPSLTIIRSANAELPAGPPLVVVLTGGTTGIGSYVAKALATTYAKNGSKLRIYIVGRNAIRAETVMDEGKRISPGSDWRFVKATDLALISEVDRCSAEIIRQETEAPFHGGPVRVDLLYMSHCYPILKERTSELPSDNCAG